MLSLSSMSGHDVTPCPSIQLPEVSFILQIILSHCDPRAQAKLDTLTLPELFSTLAAADKYQITGLGTHLLSCIKSVAPTNPLRAYALAGAGLASRALSESDNEAMRSIMHAAAKDLLKCPIPFEQTAGIPEIRDIPAGYLQDLYVYHAACSNAAVQVLTDLKRWSDAPIASCPGGCSSQGSYPFVNYNLRLGRWWLAHTEWAVGLLKRTPVGAAILINKFDFELEKSLSSVCDRCNIQYYKDVPGFREIVAAKVDEQVGKVSSLSLTRELHSEN
jgi:hypothetical protein